MSGDPHVEQSGEDRLIAEYFRPMAKHPGAFALMDDAAVIAPPAGCDIVLKTDGIIGGVHFFPDDPPDLVGKKALRVNLSDLAAKAARPLGFLLTLALPKEVGDAWLAPFARGLGDDAEFFGCPLFGGDTVTFFRRLALTFCRFVGCRCDLRRGASWQDAAPCRRTTRGPRGCDRYHRRRRTGGRAPARSQDNRAMGPQR